MMDRDELNVDAGDFARQGHSRYVHEPLDALPAVALKKNHGGLPAERDHDRRLDQADLGLEPALAARDLLS
jgi:hypothetical protein